MSVKINGKTVAEWVETVDLAKRGSGIAWGSLYSGLLETVAGFCRTIEARDKRIAELEKRCRLLKSERNDAYEELSQ